jgi:hypothetical protein
MSVVALSMSKVRWLEKGASNCVVLAAKARPWIPMHQRWLEKGARNCVVLAAKARPWIPMHQAMCSAVAGATPCLYPHGHKGKCIHQRCIMGVTLLKVFAPFQGGGLLTAHHGFFFCLLFTTTVQSTEQPSVCPLHYSGAQEPCQPIDALPHPLPQEPHQPIDNLPQL